jgi:hypothetical protein
MLSVYEDRAVFRCRRSEIGLPLPVPAMALSAARAPRWAERLSLHGTDVVVRHHTSEGDRCEIAARPAALARLAQQSAMPSAR